MSPINHSVTLILRLDRLGSCYCWNAYMHFLNARYLWKWWDTPHFSWVALLCHRNGIGGSGRPFTRNSFCIYNLFSPFSIATIGCISGHRSYLGLTPPIHAARARYRQDVCAIPEQTMQILEAIKKPVRAEGRALLRNLIENVHTLLRSSYICWDQPLWGLL